MPQITIRVSQSDIDSAKRIADRMFPGVKATVNADDVLRFCVYRGMQELRLEWGEDSNEVKNDR